MRRLKERRPNSELGSLVGTSSVSELLYTWNRSLDAGADAAGSSAVSLPFATSSRSGSRHKCSRRRLGRTREAGSRPAVVRDPRPCQRGLAFDRTRWPACGRQLGPYGSQPGGLASYLGGRPAYSSGSKARETRGGTRLYGGKSFSQGL